MIHELRSLDPHDMPRRQRTSTADAFMGAMSTLPWWVCLIVGAAANLILHRIASQPLSISGRPGELGGVVAGTMFRSLAMVGQYVIPLLCAGAAVMSYLGRRKRRELFLHVTEGGASAAAIDATSWQDFELLLGEAFRLEGFEVVEKGGAGADGGVDLELVKDEERYLVQAKHWRAKLVPVEVVRELAGVMPFRRAVGAFVVTSGRFTKPAEDFADGRGIKLVNGSKLDALLARARASLQGKDRGRRAIDVAAPPKPVALAAPSAHACPACGAEMTLRTASKGPNAGGKFWGCSTYPKCRGTRPA